MSTPTHRSSSSSGFTLIEVVVVMSIITILMGMGIPGIINAQRRADRYATVNILGTVHDACVSNAKQFGSSGAVYGFTLSYANNSVLTGANSALAIKPWVIWPNGSVRYNTTVAGQTLQADIGKEMMWTGDTIEFVDTMLPAKSIGVFRGATVLVDPAVAVAAGTNLHVAYEPRTGFVHYGTGAVAALDAATLTDPARQPVRIQLSIWRKGTTPQATNTFIIQPTGASDVRLPQ